MPLVLLLSCTPPAPVDPCTADNGAAALSTCLSPAQSDAYYAAQGTRYFDTLESDYDGESGPSYADGVARWEWPPWLLLTGYGREDMEFADAIIRLIPTSVPTRDCRFFPTQPSRAAAWTSATRTTPTKAARSTRKSPSTTQAR